MEIAYVVFGFLVFALVGYFESKSIRERQDYINRQLLFIIMTMNNELILSKISDGVYKFEGVVDVDTRDN